MSFEIMENNNNRIDKITLLPWLCNFSVVILDAFEKIEKLL